MFKLKNKIHHIIIGYIFIFLFFVLINNNYDVMAMDDHNRINTLNNVINRMTSERQELINQMESLPIGSPERENARSAQLYLATRILVHDEEINVINITNTEDLQQRITSYTRQKELLASRINTHRANRVNNMNMPRYFADLDELRYAEQYFTEKISICSRRLAQINHRSDH